VQSLTEKRKGKKKENKGIQQNFNYFHNVNIIIIIIIIIIIMQGICNCIPETNHISRVYCVAAVMYLHFVLRVMSFRP
jgi:hypothetical protein